MLVSFVGPKEFLNTKKSVLAQMFKAPVYEFAEVVRQLAFSIADSSFKKEQQKVEYTLRKKLNEVHKTFTTDWMINELISDIFNKKENSSRVVQAVILDTETHWEYRCLRDLGINPKSPRKNKFVLVESDELYALEENKDYNEYLDWDVDGVINLDSENLEKEVKELI